MCEREKRDNTNALQVPVLPCRSVCSVCEPWIRYRHKQSCLYEKDSLCDINKGNSLFKHTNSQSKKYMCDKYWRHTPLTNFWTKQNKTQNITQNRFPNSKNRQICRTLLSLQCVKLNSACAYCVNKITYQMIIETLSTWRC